MNANFAAESSIERRVAADDGHPLRAGDELPPDDFALVRRRMLLECCKWDPQVADVATLAPFPVLITRKWWHQLCRLAEALAAETTAAEGELLDRPDLHGTLAVPGRLRAAFRAAQQLGHSSAPLRVMRFDFHWTSRGWRISEVNSDVPGGFAEASDFPALMARFVPDTEPVGCPASAWASAMMERMPTGGHVALLSAPGFMEDQQVTAYLAKTLRARGAAAHLARPGQIRWRDGYAWLQSHDWSGLLSAIVRFYQAEWLASLPRRDWLGFFAGGRTPVINPGAAVLTESKRFPLVWPALKTVLPTWKHLLPESRDPRAAPWRNDSDWLLKPAFCNTGDAVISRLWTVGREWNKVCRNVWLRPGQWIAQRRFDVLPLATPRGNLFPCVGVYTINGKAAGAYTRLSAGPVVDFQAIDAALLLQTPQMEGRP